jgi:RNA-binding protein
LLAFPGAAGYRIISRQIVSVRKGKMENRLKGSQRKRLRELAHSMDPVIHIGKRGITGEVIKQIDQVLTDHELIKVRFNEFKEEKESLSTRIENETASELVGMIGHVAIFYRENSEKDKKIDLNRK